jgi:DNA-binding CsgD family transcriptional regulator
VPIAADVPDHPWTQPRAAHSRCNSSHRSMRPTPYRSLKTPAGVSPCGRRRTGSLLDRPLSPRQREVATTLMCGLTYKQADGRIGISPSTVRTHAHAAYERLAVTNLSQACVVMIRQGWTDPGELLPDYRGAPYTMRRRRGLPSPAQRLYLDAFDRLLRDRDEVTPRSSTTTSAR